MKTKKRIFEKLDKFKFKLIKEIKGETNSDKNNILVE